MLIGIGGTILHAAQKSLYAAVAALFYNGEKGVWYDPSDFSTMFQDSAGTVAVTAVGQPVGKILDKSGNGFHATQATSTARPTLGRHPITGVRNLLVGTDALATQSYTTAAVAYTLSFTGTGTITLSGAYVGSLVGTGASNRVSLTFTSTAASLTLTVSGSVTFAQLERGSAVTNYQSVVSQFDITEAGVNSAYYLYGDGVDNAMVTPSIDFTATSQMSVFSGFVMADQATFYGIVQIGPTASGGLWTYTGNAGGNIECKTQGASGVSAINVAYGSTSRTIYTILGNLNGATGADCLSIRKNGTLAGSASVVAGASTYANGTVSVGLAAGVYMKGNLYGLVIRGALSDANQIAAAEQWMNSKTGAY